MMSELVKIRRRMLEWLKLVKRWTPFTVFNVTGPSYEPLDEVLTASINRTLGIFLKAPIENFPPPLAPKLLSPKATGSLHNSGIVFPHLFKEHSFPSFLLSNMSLEDNKKPTLYPQKLTLNAEANSTAYSVPTPLALYTLFGGWGVCISLPHSWNIFLNSPHAWCSLTLRPEKPSPP